MSWFSSGNTAASQRSGFASNSALHGGTVSIQVGTAWLRLVTAWLRLDTAWLRLDTAWLRLDTAWLRLDTAWLRLDTAWLRSRSTFQCIQMHCLIFLHLLFELGVSLLAFILIVTAPFII